MARNKPKAKTAVAKKPGHSAFFWSGVAAVAIAIGGALLYFMHAKPGSSPPLRGGAQSGAQSAQYVGGKACADCHAKEFAEWGGSQHALAMQEANDNSVLGNFNDANFSYAGLTSSFFKRDGKFFVKTDDRDGRLTDFEIKYTFGVDPLQQYLIEFPDGRLQALSIAWDARAKAQGGQRWFHLYPNEKITYNDELHWTRPSQNWNFMCADCHSTGLRKNYDSNADRFQTKWAEINVACEACHGPGSKHLQWAKSKGTANSLEDESKGLSARLDERRGIGWTQNAATGNAVRAQPRTSEREIEVCAQCHSRRGQMGDGYEAGKPFLDYYQPALLMSPLYYADGQQRGEVYTWGSFLQSKMYAMGVTCSDCHNSHSGKLRAQGNVVCAACHQPSKYDAATHHHHKPDSAGAACVACHMPTTTYMVVDPRRDHSLRVPRPDVSVKFGTPNACNNCHSNRAARWAAMQVNKWYGHDPQGYQRFAAAFSAADANAFDAAAQLRAIAVDSTQPAIARATALAQLNAPMNSSTLETLTRGLRDPKPLARFAALQSLRQIPVASRPALIAPLLSDSVKAVRVEAAALLATASGEQLTAEQRDAFESAANEYMETLRYNSDRAETRMNLGAFYANRGDVAKAEEEIKAAIRLDALFIPAYVNLADIYRAGGGDEDGARVLREGLKIAPQSAMLHHALGLALVRAKHGDEALRELERAATLEPGNARFVYVYAIALHSTGKSQAAIARLEKILVAHPNDRDVLEALVSFHNERGDITEAKKYATRLRALVSN